MDKYNLASKTYMHSNKWKFFENISNMPDLTFLNRKGKDGKYNLPQVQKNLNEIKQRLKMEEIEFYNDFNVSSAQEWSKKYLNIAGTPTEKHAKLSKIIHSKELYLILSEDLNSAAAKELILQSIEEIQRQRLSGAALNSMIKKIQKLAGDASVKTIGDIFDKMYLLSDKKENLSLQQQIIGNLKDLIDVKDIMPTTKRYSKKSSPALKSLEKKLGETIWHEKLNRSSNYIRQQLNKDKSFTKYEINKILEMWEHEFTQDFLFGDRRLISNVLTMVEGKVQEVEKRIVNSELFLDIDYEFSLNDEDLYTTGGGLKTAVRLTGDEVVKRFMDTKGDTTKGESKTDTIWKGLNTGKEWHIQEKNSVATFLDEFDKTGSSSKLGSVPGQVKLQSNISLDLLLTHFLDANIFQDLEYYDLIAYLFVNYNALNHWSREDNLDLSIDRDALTDVRLNKRNANKKERAENNKFKGALNTQASLDQLMASGIMIYISDIIRMSDKPEVYDFKNYSFIIYRSEWLIPVSHILDQIIKFITDLNDSLFRLRTTSSLKGFSAEQLRQIYQNKKDAMEGDPNPNVLNYHYDPFVKIGQEAGEQAAKNIVINNIRLNFSMKALHNLNYPQNIVR